MIQDVSWLASGLLIARANSDIQVVRVLEYKENQSIALDSSNRKKEMRGLYRSSSGELYIETSSFSTDDLFATPHHIVDSLHGVIAKDRKNTKVVPLPSSWVSSSTYFCEVCSLS